MGALVDFFADLDANAAAKAKLQGIGAAQFASLKLQAADADMARGFVVANPVGTAHLTAADGVGVVHSYYTDGGLIVMPSALRKTSNGEVWVASETASAAIALARFDANFSFLGYWGRSAAADGLYLTRDFALDEVNRRIYTVGNNHVLRAFDLDTQAMLWQFGTHNACFFWLMLARLRSATARDALPSSFTRSSGSATSACCNVSNTLNKSVCSIAMTPAERLSSLSSASAAIILAASVAALMDAKRFLTAKPARPTADRLISYPCSFSQSVNVL